MHFHLHREANNCLHAIQHGLPRYRCRWGIMCLAVAAYKWKFTTKKEDAQCTQCKRPINDATSAPRRTCHTRFRHHNNILTNISAIPFFRWGGGGTFECRLPKHRRATIPRTGGRPSQELAGLQMRSRIVCTRSTFTSSGRGLLKSRSSFWFITPKQISAATCTALNSNCSLNNFSSIYVVQWVVPWA